MSLLVEPIATGWHARLALSCTLNGIGAQTVRWQPQQHKTGGGLANHCMTRAGVPRQTAQKISGHKTGSILGRYDIVNEDDLRHAMLTTQQHLYEVRHTIGTVPDRGGGSGTPLPPFFSCPSNSLKNCGGSV